METAAKPYVAGIDDSRAARHAARWAADHASRDHAPVRLVHAYRDTAAVESGLALLRGAREVVLGAHPDLAVELLARRGDVAEVLAEQSRSARMLVLGTHRMYSHRGLLTGSTSVRAAGAVACPIVVARGRFNGDPPPDAGPIVVGVDGARRSELALEFAFQEASDCGTVLVALHAWQPGAAMTREQAADALAEWLAPWSDKYPELSVVPRVVRGPALRTLLHFASSARLLVIGNRGPDAYRSLVLGGTGQHLIHHAAGPIAVVRTDIST